MRGGIGAAVCDYIAGMTDRYALEAGSFSPETPGGEG
ncbi:hypothetical protein [Thermus tengchongensis]|nr:hypothetical protein [Thermus tengchongensis]